MAISLSGSLELTGSLTVTGGINMSGSIASASYASNAELLDGRDSLTFANTGSNSFVGSQNINGAVAVTGSLTTTGVITAQSINVQQVTSSIVYSSGSNIFGNSVSNTQSMTGSVGITGSLSVNGAATFSGNTAVSSGNQLRLFQSNNGNFSYLQSITNGDFVVSTGGTANALIIANNGTATFASTIAATSATFSGNVTANNGSLFVAYSSAGTVLTVMQSDNTAGYLGTNSNHPLILRTDSTERMRITSGGNVGIGTASPAEIFQVTGGRIYANGTGTSSGITWNNYNIYQDASTNLIYRYGTTEIFKFATTNEATFSGTTGHRLYLYNAGNNPGANGMYIDSDIYPAIIFNNRVAYPGTAKIVYNTYATGYGTASLNGSFLIQGPNALQFSTGGDNVRMTITSGGKVNINNTANTTYELYVNGASYLDGYNYASSIQFIRAATNTIAPAGGNGILIFAGGNAQIRMDTANSINFDVNNSGNPFAALSIRQLGNTVSINSPDNTLPLEMRYQNVAYGYFGATSGFSGAALAYSVNGGYVYLSSSSTWITASDRNRKKNFEDYNRGLSEICNLKPTLFNLKNQSNDEPKIVGLIAQEVGEHIPEAFSDGEFIGIDYNALTVTIINAIKEQQAQIEELKLLIN